MMSTPSRPTPDTADLEPGPHQETPTRRRTRSARTVAFELSSLDTFLAGAAAALLCGEQVACGVAWLFVKPISLRGTVWETEYGVDVNSTKLSELLEVAVLLDKVRVACLARIGR